MPLDADQIEELKALIAVARKRDVNFGLCLGKKPEGTVLELHRLKAPDILARTAKKAGETTKVASGTLSVKGKVMTLMCAEDPPKGSAKMAKLFLKGIGLKMAVRIADASGTLLEEDIDEDERNEAETEADAPQATFGPNGANPGDAIPQGTVAKRRFLIERWQKIPAELTVQVRQLHREIGVKVPGSQPDLVSQRVDAWVRALIDEMQAEIDDAIDRSINAGDAKFAEVAKVIDGRLRPRVADDELLSFLRRTTLMKGDQFEAAFFRAFDEIVRSLAA